MDMQTYEVELLDLIDSSLEKFESERGVLPPVSLTRSHDRSDHGRKGSSSSDSTVSTNNDPYQVTGVTPESENKDTHEHIPTDEQTRSEPAPAFHHPITPPLPLPSPPGSASPLASPSSPHPSPHPTQCASEAVCGPTPPLWKRAFTNCASMFRFTGLAARSSADSIRNYVPSGIGKCATFGYQTVASIYVVVQTKLKYWLNYTDASDSKNILKNLTADTWGYAANGVIENAAVLVIYSSGVQAATSILIYELCGKLKPHMEHLWSRLAEQRYVSAGTDAVKWGYTMISRYLQLITLIQSLRNRNRAHLYMYPV